MVVVAKSSSPVMAANVIIKNNLDYFERDIFDKT